jgi:hypothetical protein
MWIKTALALLVLPILTALVAAGGPQQDEPSALILPDLRTLTPFDLQLQVLQGSGVRRLRFANTIWNSGPGDLDLHAAPFTLPGGVRVFQNIPTNDGDSVTLEAGVFDFHPAHGHWHWEGFGLYQVLAVSETGQAGQVVAQSDKVGYCLIDVDPMPGPEEVADPFYTSCVWTRQGITAGWTDTYEAHIGGQFVDVSALPDGLYILRSTVDPDNIILELDDGNNSAQVFFYLYDEEIFVMGADYVQPKPMPGPQ